MLNSVSHEKSSKTFTITETGPVKHAIVMMIIGLLTFILTAVKYYYNTAESIPPIAFIVGMILEAVFIYYGVEIFYYKRTTLLDKENSTIEISFRKILKSSKLTMNSRDVIDVLMVQRNDGYSVKILPPGLSKATVTVCEQVHYVNAEALVKQILEFLRAPAEKPAAPAPVPEDKKQESEKQKAPGENQ